MAFQFTGLDPTYKVPRFIGKIIWSAGAVSASSLPLYALYVGMKTSAGSMTADQDVVEVFDEDMIDAYAGARSQLAQMARAGLKAAPTSRHFIAAVAEPAGSAATATIVIGGTWSTDGEWALQIAGVRVSGTVLSTSAIDDVGADMAAKLTARTRLPVTAAYTSGSDTLTIACANLGASGKDWILHVDKTKLPAGMTLTVTGSASLGNNRVRLGASSSGAGTEDITTLLTKLQTTRYARIASGPNDATNAALWEEHVNAKAGMLSMLYEHVVFGHNGALASAQSLSQTTLNAQRAQVLWSSNLDMHPSVFAAVKTAIRASTEGATWVPDYDGFVLPGIAPHLHDDDIPLDSEQNAALNSGLTPLVSINGEVRVVRSITTYCLNGSVPDERTLDIGDAVMPDNGMLDLKLLYNEFRAANPYVSDNPKVNEFPPGAGVAFPDLWTRNVNRRMAEWFRNNWIEDPAANPPQSQYNATVRGIESLVPVVVRRVQHQLRQIVRQQAPANP